MTVEKDCRKRLWAFLPPTVILGVVLALLWATSAHAASPASIVFRGSADRKWIALTFDDNTASAPSLATLEVLREYDVPATLFLIGYAVDGFPDITNEIFQGVASGLFEVGDHTATHPDLTTLSRSDLIAQIGAGTDAFQRVTGARTVPLFRPPYGHNNSLVAEVAGDEGFRYLVLWDVGTEDWTGESAQVIENDIVSRAHTGAIVLLHMAGKNTAEALPGIVTRLRDAGYDLVQVSTMLKGNRLFLDVNPKTAVGEAVARMTGAGDMAGYNENYFGALDGLTRGQAAKVVTLVGGIHTEALDNADSPTFSDVGPTADSRGNVDPYPFDFVEEAAAAGLVEGTVDQQGARVFNPYTSITRVQLAQILARMARRLKGYPETLQGPVKSFADVPDYAANDVDLVARLGIMTGHSSERFSPWEPAQRGHVALVMSRYLDLAPFSQSDSVSSP